MITENIINYEPLPDDTIIWSKWFTTWYGKVHDYDKKTYKLYIIFEGNPNLLATMNPYDYEKNKYVVDLSKIKNAKPGTWAAIRYDYKQLKDIWFV